MLISSSERLRSKRRRHRLAAKANFPLSEVLNRGDHDAAPYMTPSDETYLSVEIALQPS